MLCILLQRIVKLKEIGFFTSSKVIRGLFSFVNLLSFEYISIEKLFKKNSSIVKKKDPI
jgi:hypothetical protein